ncbi:MAG: hypothetical protein J5787_05915 [Alphaproteobacteria bacterium]|nr:hypothetical protein [Alphaproteobacteria bacterium]
MARFKVCEYCGAALDFGETCDCKREAESQAEKWRSMTKQETTGQIRLLPEIITKERDKT